LWGEVDVISSWRAVTITTPVTLRADWTLPNPQFAAAGVIIDVHLPWQLTVSSGFLGGYLVVALPHRASSLVGVPLVAVTKAFALRRIVATDRNVLDDFHGFGGATARYRNRLSLDLSDHDAAWHVFGDDEAFFDLSMSNWTQNRLRLGGGRHLSEHMLLDLYYLRWSVMSTRTNTDVIGTTVTVDLNERPTKQ
jgi:hypothetical protein